MEEISQLGKISFDAAAVFVLHVGGTVNTQGLGDLVLGHIAGKSQFLQDLCGFQRGHILLPLL